MNPSIIRITGRPGSGKQVEEKNRNNKRLVFPGKMVSSGIFLSRQKGVIS